MIACGRLLYLTVIVLAVNIPEETVKKQYLPQANCKFSVHNGGPNGEEISGTNLNSELYYKIQCDKEEGYCLYVANCTVNNEDRNTVAHRIINENGCSEEPNLFEHVQYEDDFTAGIYNPLPIRFRGSNSAVQFFCVTVLVPKINDKCSRKLCVWNEYIAENNTGKRT